MQIDQHLVTERSMPRLPMSRLNLTATIASLLVMVSSTAMAQGVSTRFGVLTTNSENTLLFNGRPVTPTIQGNNSLSLLQVIPVGVADDVIVRDNGGTGCPSRYYVVAVSKLAVVASKSFGTCAEMMAVSRKGNGVTLNIAPFVGHGQQSTNAGKPHVFDVITGVVTDNGKPVD